MSLFVDRSIVINATPTKVWDALTDPDCTKRWTDTFLGGAEFRMSSTWMHGSPVTWRDKNGTILVEGIVTALQPHTLLRFTVMDTKGEKPELKAGDGITYELSATNGVTTLRVLQGDFSSMLHGQTSRDASEKIWDKVLPVVKSLAEAH